MPMRMEPLLCCAVTVFSVTISLPEQTVDWQSRVCWTTRPCSLTVLSNFS